MINSFSGEVNYKIKIQKSALLDVNIRGESHSQSSKNAFTCKKEEGKRLGNKSLEHKRKKLKNILEYIFYIYSINKVISQQHRLAK